MIDFAYYEMRSTSLGQSGRSDRVGDADQPHSNYSEVGNEE